jgi:hypothetical protein
MDAIRISALGAAALASPKAVQATLDPVNLIAGDGAQTVPTNPAQGLFQQALQASTAIFQGGAQAASALGLNDVPSLLAALAPPQAAASTTATTTTTTTPAVPASNVAAAALAVTDASTNAPALPDSTGSGLDFALQTALRFGAGVGPLGTPLDRMPELSAGLVRDASAVLRTAPLQDRAGGPGPEAFAQQAARTYRATPVPIPEASRLDLLA